jgi:hypothetical protein
LLKKYIKWGVWRVAVWPVLYIGRTDRKGLTPSEKYEQYWGCCVLQLIFAAISRFAVRLDIVMERNQITAITTSRVSMPTKST